VAQSIENVVTVPNAPWTVNGNAVFFSDSPLILLDEGSGEWFISPLSSVACSVGVEWISLERIDEWNCRMGACSVVLAGILNGSFRCAHEANVGMAMGK